MTDSVDDLVIPRRMALAEIGSENADELINRLHAAIGSDFVAWQENEAKIADKACSK